MKMFADHDEYANMPQAVKHVKVGKPGLRGKDDAYYIPDDSMQEADKLVAESARMLKRYSTVQK